MVGVKPREVDAMTLVEASWYMEGYEERTILQLIQTQRVVWSNIAPHTREKIGLNDFFEVAGTESKAPRSGLTAAEQKELERKFNSLKAKEDDRTSSKREGVRIKHHSQREP